MAIPLRCLAISYERSRCTSCETESSIFLNHALFQAVFITIGFLNIYQIFDTIPIRLLVLITVKNAFIKIQLHRHRCFIKLNSYLGSEGTPAALNLKPRCSRKKLLDSISTQCYVSFKYYLMERTFYGNKVFAFLSGGPGAREDR
jgi:hypothetical protein